MEEDLTLFAITLFMRLRENQAIDQRTGTFQFCFDAYKIAKGLEHSSQIIR